MTAPLPRSLQDHPRLGQWIALDPPGTVTIRTGKVELGQGILTALAQIAAEELSLPLDRITVAPADTAHAPDEGFTAGSQSVEVSGASIRLAAAQARAALLAAAAARLGLAPDDLTCEDGTIMRDDRPTGLDIWSLAADVDWTQPIRPDTTLLSAKPPRIIGTAATRIDMAAKLGTGGFIHDIAFPGMLHARVVRQPFRLARLADVDEALLHRRHPGVTLFRQADFLALLSDDEHSLARAHDAADSFVSWEEVPDRWRPATTSDAKLTETGTPPRTPPAPSNGFSSTYARGNIAHASIGPSCAIAQMEVATLTIHTHSQGIFALRDQIARVLALTPADVRVIHAHGAGCYGHNGADDAALDAAIIARHHPGRPVRVQWSRTDELSRAPLGAAMSARIEATLDQTDRIATWAMTVRSAPHAQRPGSGGHVNLTSAEALDPAFLPGHVEDLPAVTGGGASRNSVAIYRLPHQQVRVDIDTASPVRTSSLRSLGAHLNVFAIESAIDELAAIAGADPLAFRLAQLDDPRARHVLEQAAAMSGWSPAQTLPEGRGRGLAMARYKGKGAYLAAVAEISLAEDVRLDRLWLAVDAGFIVNPAGAQTQIEGGAIQAASWTLKEEVAVENGRVPPLDWDSYPILRFSEIPEIETRFVGDPASPPLGTGEAAQGPVAAAIGNALARALGLRVRQLPLTRDRIARAIAEG
jgi:CO/xanthine dehydrogenase Mo-binding subunit